MSGVLVTSFVALAAACGSDAVGVDPCRQIEEARCRTAPACGIVLEPPYHTSGSDVDACVRYYDIACRHGLAVGDPGTARVQACVSAIASGDCGLVRSPETGACAWLAPASPAPTVSTDASTDDGPASADADAAD